MSNYRNKTGTSGGSAVLRGLGRLIFFLLWTVLLMAVVLLGMIYVMEKGPSPTLTATFCRSMRETSAIRWIPDIFLSEEEIDGLKSENTENDETQAVNTSLIHVAAGEQQTEKDDSEPELQLIEIADGTVKGKLLIVKDPSRVILGTSDNLGKQAGLQLTALVQQACGDAAGAEGEGAGQPVGHEGHLAHARAEQCGARVGVEQRQLHVLEQEAHEVGRHPFGAL